MHIKLLCINTTHFKEFDKEWVVNEGDTIAALINCEGIRIEYKKGHYSLPFYFSEIEDNFISAFDEERYDKIYKKITNCKLYLGNNTSVN